MLLENLRQLLKELEIYQKTEGPKHIQENEIRSVCKCIVETVEKIKKAGQYDELTAEQKEKIKWAKCLLDGNM